jgi:hypothetical protein
MAAEGAAAARPRTTGEILDDAWRLALADAPYLLLLGGLFLVPALAGLLLLLALPSPPGPLRLLPPAGLALLLALTGVGSGACQEWLRRRSEGEVPRVGGCLAAAFRRGLEHAAARAVLLPGVVLGGLGWLLLAVLTLRSSGTTVHTILAAGLGSLLLPGLILWPNGTTIHAFLAAGKGRAPGDFADYLRQIRADAVKAGVVALSRVPLLLIAVINLFLIAHVVLWTFDGLAGFDLAFVDMQMAPTTNPVYVAALFGFAWLLLAPYFEASSFLLYLDARTRQEGLDLQLRIRRLFPAGPARRTAGVLVAALGAALLAAAPLHAAEPEGKKPLTRDEVRDLLQKPGADRPTVDVRPDDEQKKPKDDQKKPEDQPDDSDGQPGGKKGGAIPVGPAGGGLGSVGWGVLAGLGLAVLVVGGVLFFVNRRGRRPEEKAPVVAAREVERVEAPQAREYERPVAELWREADARARAGQHLQATRSLYLAVLSLLHHRGLLRCEPTRTNGEYVREIRLAAEAPPTLHAAFEEFTARFERSWYGGEPCGADEFRACRGLAEEVRALGERGV